MKYAIISDIHGNYEALKVVLDDIKKRKPDRRVCLGDIVGYGPMPRECIEAVRDFDLLVQGNHDHAVGHGKIPDNFNFHARFSVEWTVSVLPDGEREFLRELPLLSRESHFLLVHSSPFMPEQFPYIMYLDDAMDAFRYFDLPVCFLGHSHLPGIFTNQGKLLPPDKTTLAGNARVIVNAGSVGQPRNLDPRACYALYNDVSKEVEYVRLAYDIKATQEMMAKLGFPSFLSNRLSQGR